MSQIIRNTTLSLLAMTLAATWMAQPAQAVVYLESDGRVVIESEVFSSRTIAGPGDTWLVVPTESAGTGPFLNARGFGFVQSLPDQAGGGGGVFNPPTIEYQMQISTPGTYQLFLRWDGNPLVGGGGNADSIFADVVELKDGAGGTIADHYEFNHGADGNFNTTPWDGNGGFELNTAGGTPKVAANFNITSPGVYTLRVSQREDGSTVDSAVFQLSSLTAPTAFGPAPSLLAGHRLAAVLAPTADAHVQQGAAGSNFGTAPELFVKNNAAAGNTRLSYLQFDVSGQPLAGLLNAQLELEVITNSGGAAPIAYTVNVFGLIDGADDLWGENTITWNNAPANAGSSNVDLTEAVFLGQFGVPAIDPATTNDPIIVSFNNLLSASPDAFINFLMADTNGRVTFILSNVQLGNAENFQFASKENTAAMAPTRSLFTVPGPEPATGVLGLLGLATLARRRRAAA
ncbi:MAG: DNRLRE domain-containing protein [Phycisphaeraceae bacterium]